MRPAWTSLLDATEEGSAFLSATWIERWLDAFASRFDTYGLIWSTDDATPVGCALVSTIPGRVGPFTVSRSCLNASGVPGIGCEHNDVLALPAYRGEVVRDMMRRLESMRTDEIAFEGIRERLFDSILGPSSTRAWTGIRSDAPFVSLADLRAADSSYVSSLSSNTRQQIRRGIKGYEERFGPLELSVAQSADEALCWMEEMLTLHDARWSSPYPPSGFTAESRRFHRQLIQSAFERDDEQDLRVVISRVRFSDQTVGILYHLVCRGRVHFFQAGLKYDDDPRLKPGLVSHALSAQYCLEEGYDEYDFLGGEPEPVRYKMSLTSHSRVLYWSTVILPTPKSRLVGALRRVLWPLRSAKPS